MPQISVVPGTGSRRRYNPKYRITLGPFSGGINSVSDPQLLATNEAQLIQNYLIKANGSLITRPSVVGVQGAGNPPDNTHTEFCDRTSNYQILTENPSDPLYVARATFTTTTFYKGSFSAANPAAFGSVFGTGISVGDPPIQILIYNSIYYYFTQFKMYASNAEANAFASAMVGDNGYGGSPNPAIYLPALTGSNKIIRAFTIKDRMVVVTTNRIYFSKATDPLTWDTPSGGGFITTANTGTDPVTQDAFLFGNVLYICRSDGLWRWSFNVDPNTDQLFERIVTAPVYGGCVYNNEIFVYNIQGLYKVVNGYLVELSTKISNAFKKQMNINQSTLNMTGRLVKLGNLLLLGPFTDGWKPGYYSWRASDISGMYFYLVYNTELAVWTTWVFSSTNPNGVSGPYQPAVPYQNKVYFSNRYYYWAGDTYLDGLAQVFYIDGNQLNEDSGLGYDTTYKVGTGTVRCPMGYKLITGAINLGYSTMFKRFYNFIVDAIHGTSQNGAGRGWTLNADGSSIALNNPNVTDSDKLAFARSVRAKSVSVAYDGFTGLPDIPAATPTPEFTDINSIICYVSSSREVTT